MSNLNLLRKFQFITSLLVLMNLFGFLPGLNAKELPVGRLNNKNDLSQQNQSKGKSIKEVVFRFQPVISGVETIYVAGTFNDWNGSADRMYDEDGDGVYETTLILPVGRYLYKFVVDGRWITDPNSREFENDSQGGKNGVLIVDHTFQDVVNQQGDGLILVGNIPMNLDYTIVNPLEDGSIEFRIRANRNDVEDVYLIYVIDKGREKIIGMSPQESDVVYQYYRTVLHFPEFSTVHFTFHYRDGNAEYFATPKGFVLKKPDFEEMFLYTSDSIPLFKTPEWAKHGIFYQIFPDRFRNGDRSNDQDFQEKYYEAVNRLPPSGKTNDEYFHFVEDWENIGGLSQSPYRTDGKPDYYSFYGGDIAGVMEKLPYLNDLGITIIYFNPLNEAKSNHKYDSVDYLTIDPHFADEETFRVFVKRAHEYGIRIIVDMAFNHTGDWHFAFVDTKEKGNKSKYWNWYEWKRWPLPAEGPPTPCDYYDCWWGYPIHPNLNFDLSRPNDQENVFADISQADPNLEVVHYILDVARYWLGTLGIDGFRLDVPNEVPFWLWKEFRRVVDEVNPDAFLIGEIWGNAMPWLGPHYFHSTMNYKYFRDPVLKFIGLGQGDAEQFDRELAPGRNLYPIQATQTMMNLVGSHDTERFMNIAKHDDRRLMLTALFQMTYLGIPHIYYGDEVAIEGGKDPDNRRPFPWNWEREARSKKVHDFYRKVISIRHKYTALRKGRFNNVLTEGKVYAFLREDEKNRILVVINNDPFKRNIELNLQGLSVDDGTYFMDEIGGERFRVKDGKLRLGIKPVSGAILVLKESE